ncbi:hypothetical protein SIID45300_01889 [Candidatus Magnetaquicoccaceae bacterium FCR-1]|uniref:Uncharacterized protein n=1 Tax=Candidatus Magnetaquiglobus chichijimensis TaxID=3141448 RepID=A0ABQ0C9I5_9PROT
MLHIRLRYHGQTAIVAIGLQPTLEAETPGTCPERLLS